MGILSHLFARMVSDAVREDRQQKEKNKKWVETFDVLQAKENELNNYLSLVGCKQTYVFDSSAIDNGSVSTELRKMEKIRKDMEEYLSLGGDVQVVFNLDCLERRIGVLKYLRKIGQIERQYEFLDDNKYSVEDKIKAEQEALAQQTAMLRKEQESVKRSNLQHIVGGDIDTLSGIDFEYVCQSLIEKMGFATETTKASGDGGIDIVAYNHQPLLSGKYVIQCKRYAGSVGEPIIRDLYGVVMSERANKGIVITTGHFTRSAEAFAQGKPIELINGTQLKELLLQYNLSNDSCDNQVAAVSYEPMFDPEPAMGYYFEDYNAAIKMVERDPGDIKNRCVAIEKIVTTIKMRMALFELGDNGIYEINYPDLHGMINLLKDCIQPLVRQDNTNSANKRIRYIYYTCLLIYAEYSALSGDFGTSVDIFSKALIEWPEMQDKDISRLSILNTLFAIFNIMDCRELTDKYSAKFHKLLSEMKVFYSRDSKWEWEQKNNAAMMQLLNDPYHAMTIIRFSAEDIYEKCISQWGDFEIGHGAISYHIDRDNDRLMYFAQNKWDKKEKDVVVLENLSNYVDIQRNNVRRIVSRYIR